MTNRKTVAVDDGYAQMKLYGDALKGGGIERRILRSAIAVGRRGLGNIDGSDAVDVWVTDEGNAYTVSQDIATEETRFDSFHFSELNRVLVHHTLLAGGYGGMDVDLVVGLPVADFFANGARNDEHIERKKANLLKGAKLSTRQDQPANISSVRVGCQAVAAYVDWLLDDNLKERNDATSPVGIVDVGGRTTDIAVVIGGAQINHEKSGTANIGVLDVYKAVQSGIHKKFEIRDAFSLNMLEQAVRTGEIRLFGSKHDIKEVVKNAVDEQQIKIKLEIERKLGQAATLDAVVFVGGGASLFAGLPELFRNGVRPPDPEISNARGMWKFFRWRDMKTATASAAAE